MTDERGVEAAPAETQLRRVRRRAFFFGLGAVVILVGLPIFLAGVLGGGESDESPQLVMGAALTANDDLATFHVEVREEFEDGTVTSIEGRVRGRDMALTTRLAGGPAVETLVVDGRVFEQGPDGEWVESINPRTDEFDPIGELWLTLQSFDVAPVEGDDRSFTLTCPDDPSGISSQYRWICESDPPGMPRTRLDPVRTHVASLVVEGDIPTYPGVTERGVVRISVDSAAPVQLEIPTPVDRTGLQCLADELGVPDATTEQLTELIAKQTTDENGDLFLPCGFQHFPPGYDYLP